MTVPATPSEPPAPEPVASPPGLEAAAPEPPGAPAPRPAGLEDFLHPSALLSRVLADPVLRARLAHLRALEAPDEAPRSSALQAFARGVVGATDEALAVAAPEGEDEREVVRLERARRRVDDGESRWCRHEPGVVEAVGGGLGALIIHLRYVVLHGALTVLCAAGVFAIFSKLPKSTWGRAVAGIGVVLLLGWLLRLVGAAALGALDAARGRRPVYGLCASDRAQTIWALWVIAALAPRELGRALTPVAGPLPGAVLGVLGLAAFAVLLVVAMDRRANAIATFAALAREPRRLARLAAVSAIALAAAVGFGVSRVWKAKKPELLGAFVALAASAASVLVGVTAAQLVAGWSDVEARAAARARGRRTLVEGADDESWRETAAALLLCCTAMPSVAEGWATAQLGSLGALAPWVVSAGGSLRPTFVLVPLVLALVLLLLEHRRRRQLDADDEGLLLDVTPRWPGTRVPWSQVSARPDARGVTLVTAGWPALLGVWVAWDGEDQGGAELLAWLQARGARVDG